MLSNCSAVSGNHVELHAMSLGMAGITEPRAVLVVRVPQ